MDPSPGDRPATHPDVERLSSRTLHDGRVFRLLNERVRLPSGLVQDVDLVEHPGAVGVAALDGEGRLVLVRQYRHALGEWTLELPAGRLEPGEEPLTTAIRELEEETGLAAGSWSFLRTVVPAPGFCSERIHLFLARDLRAVVGSRRAPDEDEELEVVRMAPELLAAGATADAKTLIAAASLLGAPLPALPPPRP